MKRTLGIAILTSSAIAVFGLSAKADFYLGAQSGQTNYQPIAEDVSSLELAVGYKLSPNFAIEASWLELGEADIPVYDRSGNQISEVQFGVDGTQFALLAFIPLHHEISLYGRFGVLYWDQESNSITSSNLIQSNSDNENDSDLVYGGGIVWHADNRLDFRLQYQGVDIVGNDIENISAGITYSF